MKERTYNIFFCGVGGQGVLKAAEVCGVAAMLEGYHVRKSEVHGMSQRGGSVESHLRFGRHVYSPLITKGHADFLVCFDSTEGERYREFLKKGGVYFGPHLEAAKKELSDKRLVNTFCLGILSQFLPLKQDAWTAALEKNFSRFVAENREVFLKGAQFKLK